MNLLVFLMFHSVHCDPVVTNNVTNKCIHCVRIIITFKYGNSYMFRHSLAHHHGVHSRKKQSSKPSISPVYKTVTLSSMHECRDEHVYSY